MLEVTCYEGEMEIGTWDVPEGALVVGYNFDGMVVTEVHAVARCGSDATVSIEFA